MRTIEIDFYGTLETVCMKCRARFYACVGSSDGIRSTFIMTDDSNMLIVMKTDHNVVMAWFIILNQSKCSHNSQYGLQWTIVR